METVITVLVLLATLTLSKAVPVPQFRMPSVCTGKHYCTTQHELYPTEAVERVVKARKLALNNGGQISIVQRVDTGGIDEDCEVDDSENGKLIFEVTDGQGDVRIVIQSPAFSQDLTIMSCAVPGQITRETKHFSQDTVDSLQLKCVDTYLDYDFYVLTKDWMDFETARVSVPVGCICEFGKQQVQVIES